MESGTNKLMESQLDHHLVLGLPALFRCSSSRWFLDIKVKKTVTLSHTFGLRLPALSMAASQALLTNTPVDHEVRSAHDQRISHLIKCLTHRAEKNCSPPELRAELEQVRSILLGHRYPAGILNLNNVIQHTVYGILHSTPLAGTEGERLLLLS